jgi:hypothetical protein
LRNDTRKWKKERRDEEDELRGFLSFGQEDKRVSMEVYDKERDEMTFIEDGNARGRAS